MVLDMEVEQRPIVYDITAAREKASDVLTNQHGEAEISLYHVAFLLQPEGTEHSNFTQPIAKKIISISSKIC